MTLSTTHPGVSFPIRGATLGAATGGALSILLPVFIILIHILRAFFHVIRMLSRDETFNPDYLTFAIVYISLLVLIYSSFGIIPSIILGYLTGFLIGCFLILCKQYLTAAKVMAIGFFVPVTLICAILLLDSNRNILFSYASPEIDEYLFTPYLSMAVPVIYIAAGVWGARRLFHEHLRNVKKESQDDFKTG